MPLLHDHLAVSVKVLRADGTGATSTPGVCLFAHVAAAGALYNQRVLEEVCARLGLATEPHAHAGAAAGDGARRVPPELIAWPSTRARDTKVLLGHAEAH